MPERSEYIPGVPCWVDTQQPDPKAALPFYEGIFGWEFENAMPEGSGGEYFMARIRGGDVAAVGSVPEGMPPSAMWNTYVAVASADDAVEKVRAAGGTAFTDAFDVMDAGRMAVVADPEGAVFCVWEAKENIGAKVVNEHGALNFNGLATRDEQSAAAFYGAVFGWKVLSIPAGKFWMLPGYGDYLEQGTPGLREQMSQMGAPDGFIEVVAALEPIAAGDSADAGALDGDLRCRRRRGDGEGDHEARREGHRRARRRAVDPSGARRGSPGSSLRRRPVRRREQRAHRVAPGDGPQGSTIGMRCQPRARPGRALTPGRRVRGTDRAARRAVRARSPSTSTWSHAKPWAGARWPSLDASTARTTSLAELASAILTSASSSVASLAPTSGSTAAALTNSFRSSRSRAGRVAKRSDQAAGTWVELAAGQEGGHAGVVLHRPEGVGPVGEDGDVARLAEPGGEALHRRRRVDADRAAGADEIEELLRDARLGAARAAGSGLRIPEAPRPPRRRARVPRCLRRRAGRGRAGWSSR